MQHALQSPHHRAVAVPKCARQLRLLHHSDRHRLAMQHAHAGGHDRLHAVSDRVAKVQNSARPRLSLVRTDYPHLHRDSGCDYAHEHKRVEATDADGGYHGGSSAGGGGGRDGSRLATAATKPRHHHRNSRRSSISSRCDGRRSGAAHCRRTAERHLMLIHKEVRAQHGYATIDHRTAITATSIAARAVRGCWLKFGGPVGLLCALNGLRLALTHVKQGGVSDGARLDDLRHAVVQLAQGQRAQQRRVDDDTRGLMKRADQVLAGGGVDARFPTDAAVHHRKQGGGNLHDGHAAHVRGGDEPCQVADHAPAKGHHQRPPKAPAHSTQ